MQPDPQFVSIALQKLYVLLTALSLAFPANIPSPVSAIEVMGAQSNVQMVYRQNMLGTGESFNGWDPINPLLIINPVNLAGAVYPTSTEQVKAAERVVIQAPSPFKICPEYPLGGAPSNVKCGN